MICKYIKKTYLISNFFFVSVTYLFKAENPGLYDGRCVFYLGVLNSLRLGIAISVLAVQCSTDF